MTNPESYPREAYLKITKKGTSGYIQMREDVNSKLNDYELKLDENYAKVLTVVLDNADIIAENNFLNVSFNGWTASETGAIKQGDVVRFGFYTPGTETVTSWFDGTVKELRPGPNGLLTLTCKDRLDRMENVKRDTVIYSKYKRKTGWYISYDQGYRYIKDFKDADVVSPFEYIAYCSDFFFQYFAPGEYANQSPIINLAASLNNRVAQKFAANGHYISGIAAMFDTNGYGPGGGGPSYDICCNVHHDDDNKPGAKFGGDMKFYGGETANGQLIGNFDSTVNCPYLTPGEKYWLVFKATQAVGTCSPIGGQPADDAEFREICQTSTDAGATWTKDTSGLQLHMEITQFEFTELDPFQYYFDDDANKIWIYGQLDLDDDTAILTYFQLTTTLEDIFKRLIKMNTFMNGDVSANCDYLLKIYSTQGKTIAECMRELCNIFETSGTWSGRQHVFAHYVDASGINRCKVGKRLNVGDTESIIASFPEDTANDDEYIVVGEPRLNKTDRYKYSEVIVVGQDVPTKNPLIVCRSDKAKSDSYWKKVDGQSGALKITRTDLNDLGMVNEEALRLLDAVSRDLWEGSITLTGHQYSLWDNDPSSDSYGSGKIIKLNWSPMGISATKLKVKQMVLGPNRTEIYVNNTDPILLNYVTQSIGTIGRIDSYLAPVGLVDNIFIETYEDSVVTSDHDVYAKLYDENNTILVCHDKIKCRKFESTTYNSITYHIEFERGNGYADTMVRYVELLTVEHGQLKKIDLLRTVNGIEIDERARKTDTNRLIVEVTAKRA